MRHLVLLLPGIDRIGGAERQALLIASSMKQKGWRVTVVALTGSGGQTATALQQNGIEFLSLHMRKGVLDPRGWLRFRAWLRERRPDVLHAHLPHATWVARGSRLLASIPLQLDTLHTPATGNTLRKLAYRLTASISDCVTAVSQGVAKSYLDAGLIRQDRLFVIPNGLDTAYWSPGSDNRSRIRSELGISDEFLWVTTGRLEAVKDHASLLKAFTSLGDTAHLVLMGDGSLAEPLKRAAQRLGVDHRVHFLGFIDDPRPYLQAADGFALPSLWEGMPMALLEACASGLPSVASDVRGNNEVLTHAVTGLLVPPADPSALAAGMLRLMQMQHEERMEMARQARESVIERYDLDRVMDQWLSLYTGLLGAAPQSKSPA